MKALDEMKTPPHADDVVEALRERAKRGDLKFSKAEVNRIASILDRLSYRCAEAYQVVGSLAADAGCHGDRAVVKALDLLFQPLRRGKMLPFSTPMDHKRVARNRRLKKAEALAKAKSASKPVRKKARKQGQS
jgi:hypothetical protein